MIIKDHLKKIYGFYYPYKIRLGKTFRETYSFIKSSEYWDLEEINNYHNISLKKTLVHAYNNVKYYYETFTDNKIRPDDFVNNKDIQNFPFLTKDILRFQEGKSILAKNIDEAEIVKCTTGGTTGKPVSFYQIKNFNNDVFIAVRLAMWENCGYSPKSNALDLTWSFNHKTLHYNPKLNWLHLSIQFIDEKYSKSFMKQILDYNPRFIIGYPSTIFQFAQIYERYANNSLNIHGIISGSEVLYDYQKEFINNIFPARLIQWYGLSEFVGFATYCEHSDELHFLPQMGFMELIDEKGKQVTIEGELGEIVLTGYYSLASPFIRYRTGDYGIFTKNYCEKCGRNYMLVKKIIGRKQDFLISRLGKRVSLLSLNWHDDSLKGVKNFQLIQKQPGLIDVKAVVIDNYNENIPAKIKNYLANKFGREFEFIVSIVDDIPLTSRGKFKFIIQEINLE